jgi:hypothetical protein
MIISVSFCADLYVTLEESILRKKSCKSNIRHAGQSHERGSSMDLLITVERRLPRLSAIYHGGIAL